jgi:predicted O-methyltransferase YrrM
MMMPLRWSQRRRPTRRALFAISFALLLGGLFLVAAHASSRDPGTSPQPAPASSLASSQLSPELTKVLGDIRAKDKDQLSVGEEDGRFLRMLVASTQRKRALEIGTAYGYSAIWIGLGLRDTGGKLVTIEIDPVRAQDAMSNIKKAGLTDVVTVISGDAFKEIPKVAGTFDCVFVDAWKRDYIKFFDMTYPRLDKGGIFLGHNVVNKKSEMSDFLTRINTSPELLTAIMSAPSGEGVSISYKRR